MWKIYHFFKIFLLSFTIFVNFNNQIQAKTLYKLNNSQQSYKIKLDGLLNFVAIKSIQEKSYEIDLLPDLASKNYNQNNISIANDSQFDLKLSAKKTNNFELSLNSSFQFNIDDKGRRNNPYLDRFYFLGNFKYGDFEIGNNKAVNQIMKFDPSSFAVGAGGIRGKYLEYVNLPVLANSDISILSACSNNIDDPSCKNIKIPSFILLSQSPIGHGGYAIGSNSLRFANNLTTNSAYYNSFSKNHLRTINDDSFDGVEDAFKLSYYSPRIAGFKLGASYTIDTKNNFLTNDVKNFYYPQFKNIFSVAVNYIKYFENNVKLSISSTLESGESKKSYHENLLSYDFASTLSYFGFKFSGAFGKWLEYGAIKNDIYSCQYNADLALSLQNCNNYIQRNEKPYYYSLGLFYEFGPIASSITSLNSIFEKNKYSAISFGIDYKLDKDLIPYIEITKFNFKSNQPMASDIFNQYSISSDYRQIRDNSGYVLLTGIQYSF